MRTFSIAMIIGIALLASASIGGAYAATDARTFEAHQTIAAQQQQVDQHDDTRVAVQLTVLGLAAVVVVVVGTGAYFLRKKLGLTAPPPQQTGGGHH
jgi:flagellar biosynthesis protein FliP